MKSGALSQKILTFVPKFTPMKFTPMKFTLFNKHSHESKVTHSYKSLQDWCLSSHYRIGLYIADIELRSRGE